MKLASSTWGASANTLRSSALALCYSAAEYCAPVWSRSANTSQVNVQLNSTMRLIFGTLCSTPLPWLPVVSNIELPALRRKDATIDALDVLCDLFAIAKFLWIAQSNISHYLFIENVTHYLHYAGMFTLCSVSDSDWYWVKWFTLCSLTGRYPTSKA